MTSATYAVRRNQNLYRQKSRMQLGPVSVGFVTVATIVVLALLYLTQITKTSVFGYKVSELKAKRDKIQADQQELQIEAARLQSIQQIQNSPAVAGMVSTDQVTYAQ
jgi:hypothetical protein